MRALPSVASQVARWLAASPASVHLDVGETGAVAERHLAQRIGLAGRGAGQRHVGLDDGGAGAGRRADDVARGDEAPFLAGAGEHQQQRLGQLGALGDADDGAVGHERGVERDDRLLAGRALADQAVAATWRAPQPAA